MLTLGRSSRIRPRIAGGFVLALVITFVVMAVPNLDNAKQVFNQSLDAVLDATESGNPVRQFAMLAFAGYAAAVLATIARPSFRFNPIVMIPLTAFVLLILASTIWAADPGLSLRRASALTLMIVAALAAAALFDMRSLARIAVLFAGIIVLAAVLAQVLIGPFTPLSGDWRLAGVLHPVKVSWYCGLGVLGSVAIARFEPPVRTAASVAALAFSAVLLLTKTRTGIAATLVGVAAILLLSAQPATRHRFVASVTWLVLGFFLFALAVPGDQLTWRATFADAAQVTSFGRTDAVQYVATFTGRLPVWEASLQLAAERPLLGYGYSAFGSPEMIPAFAEASGWVPTSAHSGYVDTILSLGLVGLALLVLVLLGGIGTSVRLSRDYPYYAFAAAVLLWLAVNLAFEAPLLYDAIFTSFLVFAILLKVGLFPIHDSEEAGRHAAT